MLVFCILVYLDAASYAYTISEKSKTLCNYINFALLQKRPLIFKEYSCIAFNSCITVTNHNSVMGHFSIQLDTIFFLKQKIIVGCEYIEVIRI